MAKLFIQDTTLTAIADAIREKTGASAPAYEYYDYMSVADGRKSMGAGDYEYISYTFPGATSIKVQVTWINKQYTGITTGKGVFMICEGAVTSGGYGGVDVKDALTVEYQSDSFTIFVTGKCAVYSWELKVYGYDADGNQIQYAKEIEGGSAPATYKPTEMPAAILSISGEGGGGITPVGTKDILENGDYDVTQYASAHVEVPVGVFPSGDLAISANGKYTVTEKETVTVLVPSSGSTEIPSVELSGNCDSTCKGGNKFAKVYIENYPDKITTSYINNADNMFSGAEFTSIPITLNFYGNSLSCNSMFYSCKTLESLPTLVNMAPNALNGAFYMCEKLRYMNELADVDMRYFDTDYYAYGSEVITYCRSLRSIPSNFTKGLGRCRYDNEWNHPYFNDFVGCYNLDELLELGVSPATLTYNFFGNTLQNACALRRFTFEVNEDGSPKTANWTGQVIKLSTCVGWGKKNTYYTQNSGRSSADFMYDSATYAANKNNPNRIAMSETSETDAIKYATYNKASAIETINTLPDTSASGGANTIKFKGAAGSATDEGAINTMTDAQIAVAAAKGWTVTFE